MNTALKRAIVVKWLICCYLPQLVSLGHPTFLPLHSLSHTPGPLEAQRVLTNQSPGSGSSEHALSSESTHHVSEGLEGEQGRPMVRGAGETTVKGSRGDHW